MLAGAVPPTVEAKNEIETLPPAVNVAVLDENAGEMLFVRQQESCCPATGETAADRVPVPAKLPSLKMLTLSATEPPLTMVMAFGDATTKKSTVLTVTAIVALAEVAPLIPVKVSMPPDPPEGTDIVRVEDAVLKPDPSFVRVAEGAEPVIPLVPEAVKVTAPLKPLTPLRVTEVVPVPP